LNPATFGQIDIKNPLSRGGIGAWELAARLSAINLNDGPYAGSYFSNLMAISQNNGVAHAVVANSGVLGGREENFTLGLNWYPNPGFRVGKSTITRDSGGPAMPWFTAVVLRK
jgi:phosphate-selective porin OprO/OprP